MQENILKVLSVVHHMTYSEVEEIFNKWLEQGVVNVIVCGQHSNEFMLLHLQKDNCIKPLKTEVLYVGYFDSKKEI